MDVLQAAWQASGGPTSPGLTFHLGRCARCNITDAVTPAGMVVSAKWTGWSSWRTAATPSLCKACSWGYRTQELRAGAFLIATDPSMTALTPAALLQVLSAPLPSHHTVVLPLHRNRKHVLPDARWGRLCVDDAALDWTTDDAARLQAMTQLRSLGFTTTAMIQPAPPFAVLRRLPASMYATVFIWWDQLRPWRPNTPWFAAAALTTGLAHQAAAA